MLNSKICQNRLYRLLHKYLFFGSNSSLKTMANWEEEKKKMLDMDLDQKRKKYLCKEFLNLENIPTWKELAEVELLPEKIPTEGNYGIDSSKNGFLVEKVSLFNGDITSLEIDCIVNAANSSLLGGGGVDGAIHRAAGKTLFEECKTLGGCRTGDAKITGGYNLPSKYVIHTVGPRGEKPGDLKSCYQNSLDIMLTHNLRTIAFPCIATGIYGYPNESAAHVAIGVIRHYLEKHMDKVDRVIFCLFMDVDKDIYKRLMQSYFPII